MTTETIILIAVTIFWISYYVFEGLHDACVINQRNYMIGLLNQNGIKKDEEKLYDWNNGFHDYDTWEKIHTKLAIAVLIYFVCDSVIYSLLMLTLSVAIRVAIHDLVISINIGQAWDYVGVTDTNFWDIFLQKMKAKGISPTLIRLSIIVSSILTIIIYQNCRG
jgi:hypothetical protein